MVGWGWGDEVGGGWGGGAERSKMQAFCQRVCSVVGEHTSKQASQETCRIK